MMKEDTKNKIILLIVWIMAIIILPMLYFNYQALNKIICQTQKAKIKSVITSVGMNPNYPSINLSNNTAFTVTIKKAIKEWDNLSRDYFEIGDSVIKEANSKKIMVKRGDDYAIYILDCDD